MRRYGGGLSEFEAVLQEAAYAEPEPDAPKSKPKRKKKAMSKAEAQKVAANLEGFDGQIQGGRLVKG